MAPGATGRSILVIRLKSLGDILLSTVIPAALRKAWPGTAVDYLVDPAFAGVAAAFPGVRSELVRPPGWAARLAFLASIQGRYDMAIDLHGSAAAAVLARFASRGPVLGWSGKRLSRLYTVAVEDRDPGRHTTEVNLDMVRALGLPDPGVPTFDPPADPAVTARWASRVATPAVLLHPGARFPAKAWPPTRWADLARLLEARGLVPHLLVGPGESVPRELAFLPAVRDVPAAELVLLARAFEGFIGTDSGPMHAAAAAGVRVVGLFGPSDPSRWRPWGPRCRFVSVACRCGAGWQGACRYPAAACMEGLDVDRVLAAYAMTA